MSDDSSNLVIAPSLLARLRAATNVMILTGAGISAESGIPTFRDPVTGFWSRYRPEELASMAGYRANPRRGWAWYAMRFAQLHSVEPNPGHHALARLAEYYPTCTLVTQNVDGLHTRAGSQDVIELHGNIARSRCLDENTLVDYVAPANAPVVTEEAMQRGEWPEVPTCPRCGAPLRPDVVWFGEALPAEALARAEEAAEACEVCFVVGTEASVWPAAGLPLTAKRHGALLVEVNPRVTDLTRRADLSLRGKAGEVLPRLVALIMQTGDA